MKYSKNVKSLEGVKEKVVVFKVARMTRKFEKVMKSEIATRAPVKKA
jgi:hypothetical protein